MEWSETRIIQLIEEYKKHPILWDPQHKHHFRKADKADAWREISVEMDISPDQCKKKMISLLSSYRREKAKIKSSLGTGKGRDEVYVSRWFGYDAFRFLEDRDVPRNRLTTETDEIVGTEDDVEANISKDSQQEPTASTSTSRPSKRGRTESNDSMMRTAFNILQSAALHLEKEPSNKPDEIDAFFTYVAAKVKKYSPETQKSVQHAVFDILVKADNGFFESTSSNAQHSDNWEIPAESEPHPKHSQIYVCHSLESVPVSVHSPSDSLISSSPQPSPAVSEQFSDFI